MLQHLNVHDGVEGAAGEGQGVGVADNANSRVVQRTSPMPRSRVK